VAIAQPLAAAGEQQIPRFARNDKACLMLIADC